MRAHKAKRPALKSTRRTKTAPVFTDTLRSAQFSEVIFLTPVDEGLRLDFKGPVVASILLTAQRAGQLADSINQALAAAKRRYIVWYSSDGYEFQSINPNTAGTFETRKDAQNAIDADTCLYNEPGCYSIREKA
jgi:hypothetical protein